MLWQVSRILKVSPFSEEVTKLSVAQMNWIIEMYALDNPDVKIVKEGEITPVERAKAWADVLIKGVSQFSVSKKAIEAAKKLRKARGME